MLNKANRILLIFILATISLSIISTFIIQYWLDHKPCNLCIYERIPYFLSFFLLIQILFVKKYEKIILLILSIIFLTSAFLAFYHFGIEQGFFNEPLSCTSTSSTAELTKEELLEQLKLNSISCKEVSFKVFGLSLATINTIFSILLSVIFIKLFLNYGKNE
tara:strand:+ start:3407 stop:3892 length:486 start_codon:yes stop_codon:yes gene_type:complete